MIVPYNIQYYEFFYNNIKDFEVTFLNIENYFVRNFVYLYDNKPVALISYSIIYDRIEIDYLWVMPDYRNKGIGISLIEFIFKIPNMKNITLEVCVDNYAAIRLYKKMGFTIATIRKKYYKSKDGYLMIREMM